MLKRTASPRSIVVFTGVFLLLSLIFLILSRSIESANPQQAERVKSICKTLTNLGICLTTGLSMYSLSRKTASEPEGNSNAKELTPEGRKYLLALAVSALLTISVSWVESRADKVLTKLHEAESRKALMDQLDPFMKDMLSPLNNAIADQAKKISSETNKIGSNLNAVKDEVSNTNEDVDNLRNNIAMSSSDLLTRLQHSANEQRLSNKEVTGLLIELYVPNAQISANHKRNRTVSEITQQLGQDAKIKCDPVFAAGKDKEGWEDVPLSDRLATVPVTERLDCSAAQTKLSNWTYTADLFSYFDPDNHKQVSFSFLLSGFIARIGRADQTHDITFGFLNNNRQFFDAIQKIHNTPPKPDEMVDYFSLPHIGDGAPRPGIAFWVNSTNVEFGGGTRFGYETDLMTFNAIACDDHKVSETKAAMLTHLKAFPSDRPLVAEVIITDKSGNSFHKPYVLKPRKISFEPSVEGECLKLNYELF